MFEKFKKGYRDAVSKFTEPPVQSQFYEKGILTPQEFIEACDKLIHVNPMWQWGEAMKESKKNKYLPDKKQFIFADIVSRKRLHDDEGIQIVEKDGFSIIGNSNEVETVELTEEKEEEV